MDVSALVDVGVAKAVLLQVQVMNPDMAGQTYLAVRKNGTAWVAGSGAPLVGGYSNTETVGGLLIAEVDSNGVFEYIAYGINNETKTTGKIYYLGQIL